MARAQTKRQKQISYMRSSREYQGHQEIRLVRKSRGLQKIYDHYIIV